MQLESSLNEFKVAKAKQQIVLKLSMGQYIKLQKYAYIVNNKYNIEPEKKVSQDFIE